MKKKSWLLIVLPLFVFLLPALLPVLRIAQWPCTHDNDLHYYRFTAMRDALRHGWLFSRWVPNLALGYGYPFFNFREPLPYLAGEFLALLGLPLPLVLGLLYTVSFVAAGWGAYALANDLFGERAGWVAALSYGLGPYLLLDALRRGNLTESIALALLPWLLFTFRRVITRGGPRPFVASVSLLAALFLSHNISSLTFAPFLGGYVLLLSYFHRERKTWPWAFVAVGVAVALTACFWLPALLEQDTVQLHLSRTTRNNDFHYNFATWREMLFTWPTPADPDYVNAPMRVPLGVARWMLAVVGLALGLWRARTAKQRALLVFFALVAVAYLWMSTAASVGIWEAFDLLAFAQFPWRLVGRALLPVALLGGAGFSSRKSQVASRKSQVEYPTSCLLPPASQVLFYLALIVLALFSYPCTYPPKGMCDVVPYPQIADVYAFEQAGWMGVDPESSYFPIWVEQHPTDTALAEAYIRGEEPVRLDAAALPAGARVLSATYRPLRATLDIESPVAFQARWLGLYYPGWQVKVDGETVPVIPAEDTGLLTFPVPAGAHTIRVRFGATPVRRMANAISLVTLLGAGIVASRTLHVATCNLQVKRQTSKIKNQNFLLFSCILLVTKLAFIDNFATPLRRSRLAAGELPEVTTPVQQPFAGGMTLLGYTPAADTLPADGELRVDLLWQAREVPATEYRTSVLLMGADGQPWSYAGTLRPRGYEPPPPTTQWVPGLYAYDPHIVTLLPGTPPGPYQVIVSLFDRHTLQPASVLGADGNPVGPTFALGTVRVHRPQQPPDLRALDVPGGADYWFCDPLGLLAMTLDRATAAPGDTVAVRWVWEQMQPAGLLTAPTPLTATLVLQDVGGTARRVWELPPSAAWWPTNLWAGGEHWVGRHILHLPADLESATFTLSTYLPGCDLPLATAALNVTAPTRVWNVPPDFESASVEFGERVGLAGYVITPQTLAPGETLTVRLAWQALAEMSTSYRIFVHLRDVDGNTVAQSDGIPVAWTRPTTGWAVGEVLVDEHSLTLPADMAAGDYALWVGVYELDGPRLSIAQHGDAFVVGVVEVGW